MPVSRFALFALAPIVAACAPAASVEGPSLVSIVDGPLAKSRQPAGARPASCVVSGKGDPRSLTSFEIFASASEPDPIAVVRSPDEVPLSFEAWPSYETGGRASVQLAGNGVVTMRGFVDLEQRRFQLAKRTDLAGSQVFAEPGTVVKVRGAHHGGLFVDIPTPFADPTKLGVAVPCDGVAYEPETLAKRAGSSGEATMLESREAMMTFFTAPQGPAIFHANVGEGRSLSVLERRDGFAHVRLGQEPDLWLGEGTLIVDAWVRSDALVVPKPNTDRDSHCGIPDKYDRCGDTPRLGHDTPLRLGSKGPTIGVAEAGAYVETGERADGHVAITFTYAVIAAPPGKTFFVAEDAIVPCSESGGDADGCPCSP
ncbi:MAG: hypothetical protein HOV80_22895 [Polyangiaceae bacterium]|nr:hypothetical protein [Polyangiaceae bacterium]